jgi:hypothetical protein
MAAGIMLFRNLPPDFDALWVVRPLRVGRHSEAARGEPQQQQQHYGNRNATALTVAARLFELRFKHGEQLL